MVTISEIIKDAKEYGQFNRYYIVPGKDPAFHIHIFEDYSFVCFKQRSKTARVITIDEFLNAINSSCNSFSIREEDYYNLFLL